MELVDFLRARLDEDERQARAAMTFQAAEWRVETSGIITTSADTDVYTDDRELAEHIARHDPARVLAEVEAKRDAIVLHGGDLRMQLMFCSHCEQDTPCPTLRLLARPFRDHPDFDPAWMED